MRLDRAPVGRWQDVPASLATVLGTALDIGRASGGLSTSASAASSPIGASGPTRAGRARRRAPVAARRWMRSKSTICVNRVRKHAPTALDLSGIAKGFGVRRTRAGPGRSRHRVLPGRHRRGDARERTQARGIAVVDRDRKGRTPPPAPSKGSSISRTRRSRPRETIASSATDPRAGSRTRSTRAQAPPRPERGRVRHRDRPDRHDHPTRSPRPDGAGSDGRRRPRDPMGRGMPLHPPSGRRLVPGDRIRRVRRRARTARSAGRLTTVTPSVRLAPRTFSSKGKTQNGISRPHAVMSAIPAETRRRRRDHGRTGSTRPASFGRFPLSASASASRRCLTGSA